MLHDFVTVNRDEIVRRCRAKVASRPQPLPPLDEINHGVPMFLDQLVIELRAGPTRNEAITRTAMQHGSEFRRHGYTVSQLVHDYGDVCQAVTDLAVERHADIAAEDFGALNRCLDDAIASAVTEYSTERQNGIDLTSTKESERLSALVRALGVCLDAATVAFDAIRSGGVGLAGGTGAVLERNLAGAKHLNNRLVAEFSPGEIPPVAGAKGCESKVTGR
jgi:hypothetical protein